MTDNSDSFLIPHLGGVLVWLMLFFVCGLGIIFLFARQSSSYPQFLSLMGVCFLIAGAVFVSGMLIGFIFGIPRILSQEPRSLESNDSDGTETKVKSLIYGENSNLDQISDWLTKILVGVGLTQLTQVPKALQMYSENIESALGDFPSSGTFGVAILIYYVVDGFLIGYLWTRRCAAVEFKKGVDELKKEREEFASILQQLNREKDEFGKKMEELKNEKEDLDKNVDNLKKEKDEIETKTLQLVDKIREVDIKMKEVEDKNV
ncbi:hypothetical protein MSBRW_2389 [Methanosarcina barkeri str. Wiesmoor]|uniref:Uncharacterized protein n=2 Tax=Methanosarcina barkeri TaxID=2208 RepID=A0A0E3QP25_METBA|nr:hypothetical protein [Methanosarcina barkeri]AKB51642.1 hypothetical protein MSBRW_2389 [Methanosarcina barkeri str. Wiesmoor]